MISRTVLSSSAFRDARTGRTDRSCRTARSTTCRRPTSGPGASWFVSHGHRCGVEDFALFGHSFGALVMLETARRLERIHAPTGRALVAVAACAAPHLPPFARFDEMAPMQVAEALQDLGGLDFSGPRGDEPAALVLPSLSADCRASTRYPDAPGQGTIGSPILAQSGTLDPAVTTEKMAPWRDYTDSGSAVRAHAGGHSFPPESDLPLREMVEWTPEPRR
ncbi:thioesterase domain-containing protein [Streptomyces scopuliridis]|uniref:Thioesterase domain-containing protein n=1 Tax=Streptomyces scopuliridis TaxID=452529 RepID=A0ACD4ZD95_9ACTN|nr:thioesterase domain-containing protein [Streptomyces scopuliridis]WSB95766.1 thioesterase domain-containing protein [Streptomyces scopuliridis]WSC10527.1 thioesterase domain-containing protein [Streptomyces scopuliridis]